MNSRMKLAAVLLLTALVTGCAAPIKYSALRQEIKAEDGVVAVKLIGVQPLSAFNAKWGILKLADATTGRTEELRDTAPSTTGYSLFLGTLRPGKYNITGFASDGAAPTAFGILPALIIMGMTSDSQSLASQLGTFTVKSGELSNLGVIVSALPEGKKTTFEVTALADAAGQASVVDDVEPDSQARLRALRTRGWDQVPEPGATARALQLVRTRAQNVSAMEILEGDRLAIGSALGMVHVRSPQGTWSSMSTGSLDNITLVRSLSGGRLFAGTDNGRYHLWLPDQNIWRSYEAHRGERVVQLEALDAFGYALLTYMAQWNGMGMPGLNRISFKADLDNGEKPRPIVEIHSGSALGAVPMQYDGTVLRVFFNHVGMSRNADVYRVNPATLQYKMETVDHWALGFYRMPDGTLVRDRMNGLNLYSDFSNDNGASWSRNDTPEPSSPRFVNKQVGYGAKLLTSGWSTVMLALQKTTDGGKTWVKVGEPFESSGPSSIRIVGDTLMVFTGKQLLSTKDEGKTWAIEWPRASS